MGPRVVSSVCRRGLEWWLTLAKGSYAPWTRLEESCSSNTVVGDIKMMWVASCRGSKRGVAKANFRPFPSAAPCPGA
jgi:hypothetical protein